MSLTSAKLRNIPGPDAKRVVSAYLDSSKDFDPTYDSIYDASSSVVLSNSCEIASTSGYSAKSEVTAINTHEALPTAINGLNVSQSSNFHIGTKIYIIQKLINWKKAIIKKPDTSQDGETTRKEILSDIKSLSIFERSVSCDVTIDIEGLKANETTAKGKVENPKNRWISSSTCYWWIWLLIFLIVISSLIGLSMTYIIMTMKSDPEPAKFFEDSLWVERLEWNAKNPKKVTALDLTSSRRIIVFSSRTDECSTKVSHAHKIKTKYKFDYDET